MTSLSIHVRPRIGIARGTIWFQSYLVEPFNDLLKIMFNDIFNIINLDTIFSDYSFFSSLLREKKSYKKPSGMLSVNTSNMSGGMHFNQRENTMVFESGQCYQDKKECLHNQFHFWDVLQWLQPLSRILPQIHFGASLTTILSTISSIIKNIGLSCF